MDALSAVMENKIKSITMQIHLNKPLRSHLLYSVLLIFAQAAKQAPEHDYPAYHSN